jgi:hypothetical protein
VDRRKRGLDELNPHPFLAFALLGSLSLIMLALSVIGGVHLRRTLFVTILVVWGAVVTVFSWWMYFRLRRTWTP